jgi:hypothetical protein
MATQDEEKGSSTNVSDKQNQPLNVRFDLEGSQRIDDFESSLDEVDEFLELSSVSNPPSRSSIDSTNIIINGTSSENKSTLNRYKR